MGKKIAKCVQCVCCLAKWKQGIVDCHILTLPRRRGHHTWAARRQWTSPDQDGKQKGNGTNKQKETWLRYPCQLLITTRGCFANITRLPMLVAQETEQALP